MRIFKPAKIRRKLIREKRSSRNYSEKSSSSSNYYSYTREKNRSM